MGFSSSLSNSAELDEHCNDSLAAAGGPSRDGGVPDTEKAKSIAIVQQKRFSLLKFFIYIRQPFP